jgi:uncharacterized tellurite resistance protein B-like protein
MFDLIKKMFCSDKDKVNATQEDALTAHLALAVLLMEAAYADGECSRQEKEHLADTLVTGFGISRDEIDDLMARSDKAHKEYVDLFQYTRFINDNFSEAQRIGILESVWRIILLDDHLEDHENHFVHKLATLLGFSHKDLIDAKLRAREHLAPES